MPQIKDGLVLVRVSYAGLSNFDKEASRGKRNRALSRSLKTGAVVSGIEMAGIVESDGHKFKRGDRVVGALTAITALERIAETPTSLSPGLTPTRLLWSERY